MATQHFGCLRDDETISVKEIRQRFNISEATLSRTLKALRLKPVQAFGTRLLSGRQVRLAVEGFGEQEEEETVE